MGAIGKREYEKDVVWITLQDRQFKWKKEIIPKVKGYGSDLMSTFYTNTNHREKFLNLTLFRTREEVDIGTIQSNLITITQVIMVDFCVYLVLLSMLTILFTKIKEVIVGGMMQDVKVGIKRSSTIPLTIMDKVLLVMVEVELGSRQALLPPIIQVILVDHWIFIVMFMTEVDIGLRPENFLHITMVGCIFPTH